MQQLFRLSDKNARHVLVRVRDSKTSHDSVSLYRQASEIQYTAPKIILCKFILRWVIVVFQAFNRDQNKLKCGKTKSRKELTERGWHYVVLICIT